MLADPCKPFYSDFQQFPVHPNEEMELFTVPGQTSAIDVYLIGSVNGAQVVGLDECKLRLYALSDGMQTLVKQRPLTTAARGLVLRGRGGVTRWRVALQGGSSTSLTTQLADWSYVAWGREPCPNEGEDAADPLLVGARLPQFSGLFPVVNTLALTTSPCFVRQAFGNLQTAGDTWIQLWGGGIGGGNPLLSELLLSSVGDNYNFDFRDPHPLALQSDGRPVSSFHVAASSTPNVFTAVVRNFSITYEIRS